MVFLFAAKYDVAVSMACPGLDYIVVETTSATQRCDELLQKENLGVATFMILVTFNFILYNIQVTYTVQKVTLIFLELERPCFT